MSEPRAVVIGYGYAGRGFHSYLIGLDSGLTLHGVSSRNPETRQRITEERGCRAYESFEQVIGDPEVDLVVLATPHDTHAGLAIRAMDAGKHVVTDKPMCTSLEECDRMMAASERNGRLLTVFQNRRWDGDFLTLRDLLGRGAIGRLRWLEMAWQVFGPPRGWRGQAEHGGGRLFDLGTHMLDQVLLLIPHAVHSVYCRMHCDFPEHDIDSHAMVVLSFDGGATAVVDAGGMHAIPKPRIHAFGSEGAFRKYGRDPQEAAMRAGDIDSAVEPEEDYGLLKTKEEEHPVPTMPGRWRSFYENVADALAGRAKPAVTLPSVRRTIAVLDAAFDSVRTGDVVHTDIPGLKG
jgi:scyllo-inositol 2-dehydrogenase (NADP+)